MKNIVYILSILLLVIACEKVIDVPVNEAEQEVVIEGKLYDQPYQSFIKLSKTGSVYDDTGFEKISGAVVTVTDDNGGLYNFTEDPNEPGKYIDTSFLTVPNTVYNMSVQAEGQTYTAQSITKSPVTFDSLTYLIQFGGFGSSDTTFLVFYSFSDDVSQENYYRIIPFVNGERSDVLYLQDDQLFNGNNVSAPFFAEDVRAGDTVMAVLVSMDKANYKYFNSLSNADGGPFSPTPANPVSNIEGGALGFFGAYITYNDSIVIPE